MEKQTLCSVHGVACWDYTTSLSQYFSLKEVNFVRVCVRSPSLHGDNGGGGNTLHLPCGVRREKMQEEKGKE